MLVPPKQSAEQLKHCQAQVSTAAAKILPSPKRPQRSAQTLYVRRYNARMAAGGGDDSDEDGEDEFGQPCPCGKPHRFDQSHKVLSQGTAGQVCCLAEHRRSGFSLTSAVSFWAQEALIGSPDLPFLRALPSCKAGRSGVHVHCQLVGYVCQLPQEGFR